MLRVLILHGWEGSPEPHWQDWLAKKLKKNGAIVSFPELPSAFFPKKDVWVSAVLKEIESFKPNVVVCHSLGCTTWFHILNSHKIEGIEKLLLVAPPRNDLDGYEDIATFFPCKLPSDIQAKKGLLVLSDDDKYLSMKEAKTVIDGLKIKTKILHDAGHINTDSGYGSFEYAYGWIVG